MIDQDNNEMDRNKKRKEAAQSSSYTENKALNFADYMQQGQDSDGDHQGSTG